MFVAIFYNCKGTIKRSVSLIQVLLHIVQTRFTYINSIWNKFQIYYLFLKTFFFILIKLHAMWRLRFCMQNVCSLCPSLLHTPTLVTWQFRVPLRKNTTRSHDIVCRFPKCEHFSQRFWVIRPNFCQSRR